MEAIFLDLNVLNAYEVDHANVRYTMDLMALSPIWKTIDLNNNVYSYNRAVGVQRRFSMIIDGRLSTNKSVSRLQKKSFMGDVTYLTPFAP